MVCYFRPFCSLINNQWQTILDHNPELWRINRPCKLGCSYMFGLVLSWIKKISYFMALHIRFKKPLFFCSWFRIDKKMTKKSTRYFWSLFIPINDIVILTWKDVTGGVARCNIFIVCFSDLFTLYSETKTRTGVLGESASRELFIFYLVAWQQTTS